MIYPFTVRPSLPNGIRPEGASVFCACIFLLHANFPFRFLPAARSFGDLSKSREGGAGNIIIITQSGGKKNTKIHFLYA